MVRDAAVRPMGMVVVIVVVVVVVVMAVMAVIVAVPVAVVGAVVAVVRVVPASEAWGVALVQVDVGVGLAVGFIAVGGLPLRGG